MAIRAAIDIGTNTVLLLLADVNGDSVRVIEDHVRVVRLGQGVDQNRSFSKEAMERASACFLEYKKILEPYGDIEIRAVATSGSRDALNSLDFFAKVEREFGIPVQVISGEEEARLSFLGAVGNSRKEDTAVLDIGGGSTEIVGLHDGNLFRFSFQIGCVRMWERFLKHDPALDTEIEALRNAVLKELSEGKGVLNLLKGRRLLAVAGTATYLGSIFMGLEKFESKRVDGMVLSLAQVGDLIEKLRTLSSAERLGLGGMDSGRADVILSGAIILESILQVTELNNFHVSTRGLRFGLIQ